MSTTTKTREFILSINEVETPADVRRWSKDLKAAYESGLVSEKAYELLQGEMIVHLRFEHGVDQSVARVWMAI